MINKSSCKTMQSSDQLGDTLGPEFGQGEKKKLSCLRQGANVLADLVLLSFQPKSDIIFKGRQHPIFLNSLHF